MRPIKSPQPHTTHNVTKSKLYIITQKANRSQNIAPNTEAVVSASSIVGFDHKRNFMQKRTQGCC